MLQRDTKVTFTQALVLGKATHTYGVSPTQMANLFRSLERSLGAQASSLLRSIVREFGPYI
jgi:hypothetical protein